jgi:glycosyltransferase involved in cell wall biosynthesis
VGSIISRKGVDLLVEAMGRLDKTYRNIHLLLVGAEKVALALERDPHFLNTLKERIRILGIRDRVRFIGLVGEVERYMRACDVFVLPSRAEGFPNALVEAMASGLAVITCSMSGIADYIVSDGEDGLVVDYTAEAIAKAIEKVYRDQNYRDYISHNARNTVLKRFSAEVIDEQHTSVYKALFQTNKKKS